MASQKISQFTPVTTLASGDFFPIVLVAGGTNNRADVGVLDARYTSTASGTAALALGATALASGTAALALGATALASGTAALALGATALASGNAALDDLNDKYDKTGGPITGVVTTESRAIGRPGVLGVVSGTIALDFSSANNFELTLVSSGFLNNPVLPSGGQSGVVVIRQNLEGSGILSYGSSWKFSNGTKPTLTATSSGLDVLSYYCMSPSAIASSALVNLL
jgi:hypothetical protein